MPNYDYVCTQCGHKQEVFQKMSETPLVDCPQCKQSTFKRRPGGGIGLQFQGSGFYITDYDGKRSSPEEKPFSKDKSAASGGCGCGKSSCSS